MRIIWNCNDMRTEVCDDCGQDVYEWYEVGATCICPDCMREHRSYDGKCDECGDTEADCFYMIDGECLCETCLDNYRKG